MHIVIVSGALANEPINGGNAGKWLNWVVALKRLGFEVRFVEQAARCCCLHSNRGQRFV